MFSVIRLLEVRRRVVVPVAMAVILGCAAWSGAQTPVWELGPAVLDPTALGHKAIALADNSSPDTAMLLDGRILYMQSFISGLPAIYDPTLMTMTWAGGIIVMRDNAIMVTITDGPKRGQVLVVGGLNTCSGFGGTCAFGNVGDVTTTDVELFDPATLTWTSQGSYPAQGQSLELARGVALHDGRVLFAGGEVYGCNSCSESRTATRIWDPVSGWGSVASMHQRRIAFRDFNLFLLPDGKVMAVGGATTAGGEDDFPAQAEVYDPASDTWTLTGPPLNRPDAALLADGRVLITGGESTDSGMLSATYFFNPKVYDDPSQTPEAAWTSGPPLPQGRRHDSSLLLPDGRVLFAGGFTTAGSARMPDVFFVPGAGGSADSWVIGAADGPSSGPLYFVGGQPLMWDGTAWVLRMVSPPTVVLTGPTQPLPGLSGALTTVSLDASSSFNPDGDAIVSYVWADNGTPIGTGAVLHPSLPLGTHVITVTVTDSSNQVATGSITVTVVDAVDALTTQVSSLQSQLADATAQLATATSANATLTTANAQLTSQVTALQAQVAAANATIAALNAQLASLTTLLSTSFSDPAFTLPGSTPQAQIQSLVTAVNGLNHGQQQALYKNLGGKK